MARAGGRGGLNSGRAAWLVLLFAVLGAGSLPAQPVTAPVAPVLPPRGGPAPAMVQPTHALTREDVESWLDGMLPFALKQGDVAGAVVSVVKDGRPLLAKGYGYADMARRVPMDADRTLVRPGSTSKLFTWTAVMQLVEQGRLDLHADVNRYLDFRVPEPFGRPITLADLMAHRGGFEEGLKDAEVPTPGQLQPLGVFLCRHLRPVLFPPGEVPAYSNYGTALAGYIVERVSGERFEDYVARHLFRPLGMARSTFRQPLPPIAGTTLSAGYFAATDAPHPFELISFGPAGALTTTASDMGRFMLAHLSDGRGLLRPETARLMHAPSTPAPAGFDVMAHGFFRGIRNGRVILEHGGDTILFHSDLALFPEEGVGLFVSFNSRGRDDAAYGIRERLVSGFADRYFPAPAVVPPSALPTAAADAQTMAGRYETSRRVQSGFMSLFYVLLGQQVIAANPDGTVALSSAPGKAFREVAPGRWRQVDGERELASVIADGQRAVADSRDPVELLQPVPLRRDAGLNLPLFALSFAGLVFAALAWGVGVGTRRYYRQPPALAGRALFVRRLARIAVVADLAYLSAWFLVLSPILSSRIWFYTTARDPLIRALQIAGLVPLLAAAAGLAHAWLSLRSGRGHLAKVGGLGGVAALLGVLWIAYVGGLLSPTLSY